MLDTFRLYLPQSSVPDIELVSELPTRFSCIQSHESYGRYWYSGIYKNLKWSVREDGLSISGSLSKFKFGNNYTNLKQSDLQTVFEELNNVFGICLNNAKITQIDLGINLACKYPPYLYYKYLGRSPYYPSRNINNTTLTYSNGTRSKQLYDKLKEMRSKGDKVPWSLSSLNILRFEVKYRKKWTRFFNKKSIRVKDLLSDSFFNELKERLDEEFFSIQRVYHSNINRESITKVSEFKNLLVFQAIKHLGINEIYDLLDECVLMDSQNRTRSKRMCLDINALPIESTIDLYDQLTTTFNQTLSKL